MQDTYNLFLLLLINNLNAHYGGDITFRITRPADGALVAMAKSGFVFFNYQALKVMAMPAEFVAKFTKVNWLT